MANRQERRRIEREERKRTRQTFQDAADAGIRTMVVGDNMIAAGVGQYAAADARGTMPPKVEGEHRWMAFGAWRLSMDQARDTYDVDKLKFLDAENLVTLGIACYDCETPLGEHIPGGVAHDSTCPAPDADAQP